MARIKHIALTTKDPANVAEFYKSAFGLKELRRSPNGAVFLTDGYIHIAVLNPKDERARPTWARTGPTSPASTISASRSTTSTRPARKLEAAHGQRLTAKDGQSTLTMRDGVHANFEMKWSGPDGVVFDISHTGWEGTHGAD